jgi:DNA polymerase IV
VKADAWDTPILHADLDAFYPSVEVLKDPGLRGKPVIVGGTGTRGVVMSASYEARVFGVRSAMPATRARRLCPGAIFVPPDFEAYLDYSKRVRAVFDSFSPVVEPLALDEAFLDLRGAARMWPGPAALGEALRRDVRAATGLAVSVGIASNKFLAKLGASRAKPDGMVVLRPGEVEPFLHPLPVDDLWGVGEQTAAVLRRLGLRTIGDIARVPAVTLGRVFGALGSQIAALAAGRDDRPVVADAPRKSVGAEETFGHDLTEDVQILHALLGLADRVASRLRSQGNSGQTVTVKIRFGNFSTITRSTTLDHEVDSAAAIYATARKLLAAGLASRDTRRAIRLLGISVSQLSDWPASVQLSLERTPKWAEADRALDRVRFRFGDAALSFGSLLDGPNVGS